MSQELLVIENLNPVDVFKAGGIGPIIAMIEAEVSAEVPDTTTGKGRKAIASNAYKVSQSKTLIDKMGKTLTDSLNAQLKPINAERKLARDGLDELKDKIRQPLTIWEAGEARIKADAKAEEEAKALAIQVSADHELAALMDNEYNRQRAERIEAKRKAQLEHEAQLKIEAAAQAKFDAEQAAKALIDKAEADKLAAEQAAKLVIAQAEAAKLAAKVAAENAETARKAAIVQAETDRIIALRKAEVDKEAAIANEQARQAQEEAARKAELAKNKLELFIVNVDFNDGGISQYYYTNRDAAEEDKAFTLDESPEAQVTIVKEVLFTKFETE
jgi:colicin import membrane protein